MEIYIESSNYDYTIQHTKQSVILIQNDEELHESNSIYLSKSQLPELILNLKKIYKEYKNSGRK